MRPVRRPVPLRPSLLLPCLGRSERDERSGQLRLVTVEDSMSVVHRSEGRTPPASQALRSEIAIVCGIAGAALGGDNAGGVGRPGCRL